MWGGGAPFRVKDAAVGDGDRVDTGCASRRDEGASVEKQTFGDAPF